MNCLCSLMRSIAPRNKFKGIQNNNKMSNNPTFLFRWITFPLVITTAIGVLGLLSYGMVFLESTFKAYLLATKYIVNA